MIQRLKDGISLKRKVNLTTSEHTSKDYISLCFGNEAKTKSLISLGGPPDYYLLYWSWTGDKGKVEAFQILRGVNAIYGVSINPTPPNADVVVTGNNTFRYYNLSNGLQQIKQDITAKENQGSTHYTCHVWAAGKLYVCTNQGDILQLDAKACKGRLDCSPSDGLAIEYIVSCNKRLITGGENNSLYFFNLESEGSKSVCERHNAEAITISSQIPELLNVRIKSLAVSPNGHWLIMSLENSQIIKADISNPNIDHIKFEYLHYSAHSAAVFLVYVTH